MSHGTTRGVPIDTDVTLAADSDQLVASQKAVKAYIATTAVLVGGADIPIADGGTGASTAATAFDNLKQAASETATGVVELATTTEAQTGTDTTRVVTPAGLRAATRERLTAGRTYYVRTDGNDSNDGLTNSAGGAFLTIQKAVDAVAALDLSLYAVTIDVGNGTYTGAIALRNYVGVGPVTILGDTTTPSNVLISTTSVDAITADTVPTKYIVKGVKFTTTTSGSCIYAVNGSAVDFESVDFGACAGTAHVFASLGASIRATGNYSITGGAAQHWVVSDGGKIQCRSRTVTLTGTPAFSSRFAIAVRCGVMLVDGCTFSGSATGTRYTAVTAGIIDTSGGGATYLPGNAAGSATSPGVYQ